MTVSSPHRKKTPSRNPPTAGSSPEPPAASASSMAGMSRLQTDAAVITPAAKPRKARCAVGLTDPRKKKTSDAPRAVMKKVKPVPAAAYKTAVTGNPPFPRDSPGLPGRNGILRDISPQGS